MSRDRRDRTGSCLPLDLLPLFGVRVVMRAPRPRTPAHFPTSPPFETRITLSRPDHGANATRPYDLAPFEADPELLDQAVEHAMKVREERPWRAGPW